jgi:hypothetical protein
MRSISSPFIPVGFVPQPNQHFILPTLQAYTSSPLSFGSFLPFHSASSIHTVSHYPTPFPTHFQRYIFLSATSLPWKQISSISPTALFCCSHFRQSCFITCACGRCIHSGSIALRELRSYLTSNPCAPLCLHSCIHLSTARHKYSFFHSIYSVPSVIPMPLSTHF